jgi:hypothetical protein
MKEASMPEIRVLFVPWNKLSSAQLQSNDYLHPHDGYEYYKKNQDWLSYERKRQLSIKQEHTAELAAVRQEFNRGPGPKPIAKQVRSTPWFQKMMREWYEVWYMGQEGPLLRSLGDGHVYIRGHSMSGLGTIGLPGGSKGNLKSELKPKVVAGRLQASGLKTKFAGKVKCYNCHSAEAGEFSFAQQLANEMWALDYKSCAYFGYEGAIDSNPGLHDDDDHWKGHRTSVPSEEGKTWVRASQARRPIVPDQVASPDAKAKYLNRLSEFDNDQYKNESLFPAGRLRGPEDSDSNSEG